MTLEARIWWVSSGCTDTSDRNSDRFQKYRTQRLSALDLNNPININTTTTELNRVVPPPHHHSPVFHFPSVSFFFFIQPLEKRLEHPTR